MKLSVSHKCILQAEKYRIKFNCRAPIVIHCTAGIGRAGTLIMMAHILETLAKGAKPRNSCEILKRLRRERAYLIHV